MFDWRVWSYQYIIGINELTALMPAASIYGAGSLTGTPATKPFMVLKIGPETINAVQGHNSELTVYVHDEPGDYMAIDEILRTVTVALDRHQVKEDGAVCTEHLGSSPDLFDDGYGTIMRYASYKLVGA